MSCRIGYDSDGKIRWDSRGCWFDSKVQWALYITLNQTLICSLEIPRNPFPKTPINPCFIHMSFHSFPSSARQPNEWGQQKTQLVNPASGSGNRLGLGRVRKGVRRDENKGIIWGLVRSILYLYLTSWTRATASYSVSLSTLKNLFVYSWLITYL